MTLYPRADLKVYHLLSIVTSCESSPLGSNRIYQVQLYGRDLHFLKRPTQEEQTTLSSQTRIIRGWQNRSRSTLADAIIVAVYHKWWQNLPTRQKYHFTLPLPWKWKVAIFKLDLHFAKCTSNSLPPPQKWKVVIFSQDFIIFANCRFYTTNPPPPHPTPTSGDVHLTETWWFSDTLIQHFLVPPTPGQVLSTVDVVAIPWPLTLAEFNSMCNYLSYSLFACCSSVPRILRGILNRVMS